MAGDLVAGGHGAVQAHAGAAGGAVGGQAPIVRLRQGMKWEQCVKAASGALGTAGAGWCKASRAQGQAGARPARRRGSWLQQADAREKWGSLGGDRGTPPQLGWGTLGVAMWPHDRRTWKLRSGSSEVMRHWMA